MIDKVSVEMLDSRDGGSLPLVIDFFAEWCGPCKMVSPIFDSVAERFDDRVDFAKVDIDEQPELAERFNIMTVPTIIALRGSAVEQTVTGLTNEPALTALFEKAAQ